MHGKCWVWTAARDPQTGYGKFGQGHDIGGQRQVSAHRASFLLNRGPIADGMNVCHACDNRICVRPEHLFVGTQQDNMDDMRSKDRKPIGSRSPLALLTEAEVLEMRVRRSSGESLAALSSYYGVAEGTVWDIVIGGRWAHVGGPLDVRRKVKLTEADVIDIRSLRAFGATAADLARAWGIAHGAVNKIVSRQRWAHV